LELIIIDDGDTYNGDLWNSDSRVRYFRLRSRSSIGEKRNLACRMADGEIIVHWDDDDWYGPARVRWQVEPILRGEADVTGLINAYTLDAQTGTCWTISPELHERMFVRDLHGGTLAFRKSLLSGQLSYPAVDLAEDAALLEAMARTGARVRKLDNPGLFVYMRHPGNAWRFEPGKFFDAKGWSTVGAPEGFKTEWLETYRKACEPSAD
jgi:glycosyltransferase involved in cell wall biosynthesis